MTHESFDNSTVDTTESEALSRLNRFENLQNINKHIAQCSWLLLFLTTSIGYFTNLEAGLLSSSLALLTGFIAKRREVIFTELKMEALVEGMKRLIKG